MAICRPGDDNLADSGNNPESVLWSIFRECSTPVMILYSLYSPLPSDKKVSGLESRGGAGLGVISQMCSDWRRWGQVPVLIRCDTTHTSSSPG